MEIKGLAEYKSKLYELDERLQKASYDSDYVLYNKTLTEIYDLKDTFMTSVIEAYEKEPVSKLHEDAKESVIFILKTLRDESDDGSFHAHYFSGADARLTKKILMQEFSELIEREPFIEYAEFTDGSGDGEYIMTGKARGEFCADWDRYQDD